MIKKLDYRFGTLKHKHTHTQRGRASTTMAIPTLHTRKLLPRAWLNRVFAFVYTIAILSLFYHHFLNLINSPNTLITISLILADLILSFMWITGQAFRLNPIRRRVFPENLPQVAKESEYPALDVFICTADPFKEPPIRVVNTALSLLAYDYPVEKLSVYVSDDGGSQLTLFAFMEAAKFAKHWLPYCKKNSIVDRCPEVYFSSNHAWLPETKEIKQLYKTMEERVEKVMEKGSVCPDFISDKYNGQAFSKWTNNFTRHDHPPIIEVLLESSEEKDVDDNPMPNLIYLSREKSKVKPHNFKAGALNALLRVSATMTNAPIFLVVDCDMYSNDPITPLRALCYFLDPYMDSNFAFVQFPQRFHGLNENDIYSGEFKIGTRLDTLGLDGLLGPHFMGTGGFFRRLVLFGPPSSVFPSEFVQAGITMKPETKSIQSKDIMKLSHHVARCNYEDNTKWGSEMGFRYGCLIEDMFTSYQLQCQGWKSIFCNPKRAAFLGSTPIILNDFLSQIKRWFMGFLEISLSKYNPIFFGIGSMKPLQALCYAHYFFWPFWSIPIIIYGFLPQLALISSFPIFPKVSDPWFFLYAFLFLGAYGKHLFDFTIEGGPIFRRWWNSQRVWMMWGLSSFPFALLEYLLKSLGVATFDFNVTSKVVDNEQSKRYEQGMFEFGVASPMFFTIATAATINLFSFVRGITQVIRNGRIEELFVQISIAGFVVVNSWPIYEAMVLRSDPGKMPLKITLTSIALAWVFFMASSLAF